MMSDWIPIQKNEKHIDRERARAKELRKSQWWQDKLNRGICHYCRQKFPRDELTMDHIVPLARGGKSNKGNVVACCKKCNDAKKYLTPVEMLLRKKSADKKSNQS